MHVFLAAFPKQTRQTKKTCVSFMKTFMVGNLPAPPPQTHKKKNNTRKRLSKKFTTHPWSTPQAIPRAPTMKGFPLQPIGKGCSGCGPVRCVETTKKG